MKNIRELARVIRSKNAGPFQLTLDIIFKNREIFEQVRGSNQITAPRIARLYGVDEKNILDIIFFKPANAVKIVMPRKIASGSPGDSDVYGAQQHAPLFALDFNIEE
jgi:hypothetical protein